MILVDANVLVYSLDALAVQNAACLRFLDAALTRRIPAVLVPQVLLECYSVVTGRNRGLAALRPGDMIANIAFWRENIPVMDIRAEALDDLARLVSGSPRRGGEVYDLFLVAQMRSHGVREICTFNVRDFRLPGIRAYPPEQALAKYRVR